MSQRLIHPHTGQALEPVWTSKTGRIMWPIMGAAEDDNGGEGSTEENASGEGSKEEAGDDGKKGSEGSDGKSTEDKTEDDDKVSKKDLIAITERMKAADRRADAAEKKVKDFEDKDKDELTKATEKVTDLETSIQTLTKENQSLRLENSFALNNSFTWHDPSVVMDLVRKRDDVVIEEDGTVKGMDEALKKVAKDKPFLVKSDEDGDGSSGPPRTGSRAGTGRGKDGKPDDKAIRSRFRI